MVAKAAPHVSDSGTWEEAGLYQLAISYTDQDGKEISASVHQALEKGQTFSVESPNLEGYELADGSQETIVGVAEGENHQLVYVVRYRTAMGSYTVVTELQVDDSGYRVANSEVRQGKIGSIVSVAENAPEGYHVASGNVTTTTVTSDGQARIVLRYDLDKVPHSIYYVTDGDSYVPAQTGNVGDKVQTPENPIRAGYTFDGWDWGSEGAAPTTIPDHDVTARARWIPAEVNYTVRYWGERQHHHGDGEYRLLHTQTLTGLTGTQTADIDELAKVENSSISNSNNQYMLYQLCTNKKPVTKQISGDGTTIIDVYYEWRSVEVTFRVDYTYEWVGGTAYNIGTNPLPQIGNKYLGYVTEYITLPDQNLAETAFRERCKDDARDWVFSGWHTRYNMRDDVFPYMDWCYPKAISGDKMEIRGLECGDSDARFPINNYSTLDCPRLYLDVVAGFCRNESWKNYTKEYREDTSGNYPDMDDQSRFGVTGSVYVFNNPQDDWWLAEYRISQSPYDGTNYNNLRWGSWVPVKEINTSTNGLNHAAGSVYLYNKSHYVLELRYKRVEYNINFQDGTSSAPASQTIGWGKTVSLPKLQDREGQHFLGWYYLDSAGNVVNINGDTFTMPVSDITLFARYERTPLTVTFDSNGGTPVTAQTVGYGTSATEPAAPTRDGYKFGGWYFFSQNSETPARFSFDMPLKSNLQLFASWLQDAERKSTTWTVRHVASDGTVLATETHEGFAGDTVAAWALPASRRGRWAYASGIGATRTLSNDPASNVVEFVYTAEPMRTYVVRFVDAATGQSLAGDRIVVVRDALVNANAEDIAGYVVRNGGVGYLVADENGTATLTFFYDRAPKNASEAPGAEQPKPGKAGHKVSGDWHAVTPASYEETAAKAETSVQRASAETASSHALPQTGDAGSAPAAVAAAGGLAALLGGLLGRRRRGSRR